MKTFYCIFQNNSSATHVLIIYSKSKDMTLTTLCLTCFLGLLALLHVLRWFQAFQGSRSRSRFLRHHHRLVHRSIFFCIKPRPSALYLQCPERLLITMRNKGKKSSIVNPNSSKHCSSAQQGLLQFQVGAQTRVNGFAQDLIRLL